MKRIIGIVEATLLFLTPQFVSAARKMSCRCHDFIEYAKSDCKRRLPHGDVALAEEYDLIVRRQTARLDEATRTDRVRALLSELLPDGPNEDIVARRLAMSRSALKATLRTEVATFTAILDDLRLDQTRRHLSSGRRVERLGARLHRARKHRGERSRMPPSLAAASPAAFRATTRCRS